MNRRTNPGLGQRTVIVVADTSPLNYLVQIRCQDLMPALYERVLVPAAVVKELDHPRTPVSVRSWLSSLPEWIEVREVQSPQDPALEGLDPGEREAIQLALEEHADLLLMDERAGVRAALRQGLEVTGTLGLLVQAARRGLVDIDAALADLAATGFRSTPGLMERVRARLKG
jgi:predicted nucleic acid-binding protein